DATRRAARVRAPELQHILYGAPIIGMQVLADGRPNLPFAAIRVDVTPDSVFHGSFPLRWIVRPDRQAMYFRDRDHPCGRCPRSKCSPELRMSSCHFPRTHCSSSCCMARSSSSVTTGGLAKSG